LIETVHPVDVVVGRRLRERRIAARISQAELATELGVSAQQVQKYENGTNRVSASKLFEIARCLGTGIEWFFAGMDDPPVPTMLAEPAPQPFAVDPGSHAATRELIAAYRALPDDAARAEVLAFVRARIPEGI
jgi:transcriptional regulator with XRE-family HTH domain